MRSAFFGLHVASSGLHTARGALNVTSHNIANAEIPGFTRQVAQMQAGRPLIGTSRGMYGTGSQITSVIQIRDRFLDRKFWHQSAIHGQFSAVNQHLNFVETVFVQLPAGGSLTQAEGVLRTFHSFFSTTHDLTTRAHEPTFRTNVITNSHSLTEQIRQNAFQLQRQQLDLNREFADVITTINSLGSQIADINRQIHIFERDGSNANDLRDQRALLIDQLSELANVQVEERDFSRPGVSYDRRLSILINGYDFVDHTRINRMMLVARDNPNDPLSGTRRNEMDIAGLYDVFFEQTGSRFNIHSQTLSGKLRGIVDVRDGNGGQITASPILSGQFLVQMQLLALQESQLFMNSLNEQLLALTATDWVADRDAALAIINGTFAGMTTTFTPAPPLTTTAQANAWLAHLRGIQAERDEIISTLNAIGDALNITALFTDIADLTLADFDPIEYIMENIQEHLLELSSVTDLAGLQAFATTLVGYLDNLHDALIADADFDQNLNSDEILAAIADIGADAQTTIENLETAVVRLYEINTDYTAGLDDAITDLVAAIGALNAAIEGINELVSFGSRIEAQLAWAIGNAQRMAFALEERIAAIRAGRERGNVEDYLPLLELLRGVPFDQGPPPVPSEPGLIDDMQALIDEINLPPSDGVYSDTDDLNDLIAALQTAIDEMDTGSFQGIIDEIEAAVGLLPDGEERIVGVTSNFKGIPFYMNQLNELVRTFARAINEGRNRAGEDIDGAIGHIFGFDANGQNLGTLFFTYEDRFGGIGTMVNDDPFRSLRLWITEDGGTVAGPNPPSNVARDEMGRPLFTLDYSRFNALNFIVNPDLIDDPTLLAASSNHNIGQANNDVIHGFLAVGNDTSLFREGRLYDFIIATSNHLAVDNSQALLFRKSYEEIAMHTHNHRLSVSSVDTEEEMLNLVRFQNMFIATSRLINVLDTVYDTLINRLGNF